MLHTYQEVEQYLIKQIPGNETEKFPGQLGLDRMRAFLKKLGNPQYQYPTIHIVGTSGKGSTAFFSAKILEKAGLKVDLHTSPHLQTLRERFVVNGQIVSEPEYLKIINSLIPTINEMRESPYGVPSYFEILVASAFVYFAREKVDVAVIEAGLGGKLDGTNVLRATVAVLTNVGLDHTHILGKTKSAILRDKMQVINPRNKIAVTGVTQPHLLNILSKHCQDSGVSLLRVGKDFQATQIKAQVKAQGQFLVFNYQGKNFGTIKNISLHTPGVFQVKNATLAITACLEFARFHRLSISEAEIKKALSEDTPVGRFEIVTAPGNRKRWIIIDGAHNPDKIRALTKSLSFSYPNHLFVIVFGLKKGKSAQTMLKLLAPFANQLIISQFSQNTDLGLNLFYPAEKLFALAKETLGSRVEVALEPNLKRALQKASQLAGDKKQNMLITGSLYLVGEAREFLQVKSPA